jgi:hypothetical protein
MDDRPNRVYSGRDSENAYDGDPLDSVVVDRDIVEAVTGELGLTTDAIARALREIDHTTDSLTVGTLFSGFDPVPVGTNGDGYLYLRAEASACWDVVAENLGLTASGREAVATVHDEHVGRHERETPRSTGPSFVVACPGFPAGAIADVHTLLNRTSLTARQASVWSLSHHALSTAEIAEVLGVSKFLVASELKAVDRATGRAATASRTLDSPANEITRLVAEPTAPNWLGLEWSPWLDLEDRETLLDRLPEESGVYRARHTGWPGLLYIGESGSDGGLRSRVGHGLASGLASEKPPEGGNHDATTPLWQVNDRRSGRLEVSVAAPPTAVNRRYRRALEAALVAVYRREMGRTPDVMLNRNPLTERPDTATDPVRFATNRSLDAPDWHVWRKVTDPNWMGFGWTQPLPLEDRGQITDVGECLVRVWEPQDETNEWDHRLTFVGRSQTPVGRLFNLQRQYGGDSMFSIAEISGPSANAQNRSRQLKEAHYDLTGAHYLATGHPPRDQY